MNQPCRMGVVDSKLHVLDGLLELHGLDMVASGCACVSVGRCNVCLKP